MAAGLLFVSACVYVPRPVTPSMGAVILDADTGAAIPGAKVTILAHPEESRSASASTVTGPDGGFDLPRVEAGRWRAAIPGYVLPRPPTLVVEAEGYQPRRMMVLRWEDEQPADDAYVLDSGTILLQPAER